MGSTSYWPIPLTVLYLLLFLISSEWKQLIKIVLLMSCLRKLYIYLNKIHGNSQVGKDIFISSSVLNFIKIDLCDRVLLGAYYKKAYQLPLILTGVFHVA